MRGREGGSGELFSSVRLEERVPADHPLRVIQSLADEALMARSRRFEALYSRQGRPSTPPEMLLRATLLQAFSDCFERQLMEQINYNRLFRWFVGLPMDGAVWHPTVFTHNRDRLMEAEAAREFQHRRRRLLVATARQLQRRAQVARQHLEAARRHPAHALLVDRWLSPLGDPTAKQPAAEGRQVVGHSAPRHAVAHQVAKGVEHLAQGVLALTGTLMQQGQVIRNKYLIVIGHIRRIRLASSHHDAN